MKKNKLLHFYMDQHYTINIAKETDEEGGSYIASIPELGSGAFVGMGDTIEEALIELNEIKEYYFKNHIQKGIEIPLPSKKKMESRDFSGKFILRIPKYLHAKLFN